MMKRVQKAVLAAVLSMAALGGLAGPKQVEAASRQPDNLYLLQNSDFYDSHSGKSKPTGALGAHQFIKVAGTDLKKGEDGVIHWYLVKTWRGNKWIKADQRNQLTQLSGTYATADRTITAMFPFDLHDRPGTVPSYFGMKPQKLHVTATFSYYPVSFNNVREFNGQSGIWYLVDTKYGKKWIVDPILLENVKETPVSYDMKLTGKETAYPNPFVIPSTAEALEPQTVQVTATWYDGVGPQGKTWYKVRLSQGDRWITPEHDVEVIQTP